MRYWCEDILKGEEDNGIQNLPQIYGNWFMLKVFLVGVGIGQVEIRRKAF